jgi:hypothetical protein
VLGGSSGRNGARICRKGEKGECFMNFKCLSATASQGSAALRSSGVRSLAPGQDRSSSCPTTLIGASFNTRRTLSPTELESWWHVAEGRRLLVALAWRCAWSVRAKLSNSRKGRPSRPCWHVVRSERVTAAMVEQPLHAFLEFLEDNRVAQALCRGNSEWGYGGK